MVVMAVVIVAMVVVGGRRMGVIVMMMLDLIATRIARMRAKDRDQAGQNGAQQRQEYDCLVHAPP